MLGCMARLFEALFLRTEWIGMEIGLKWALGGKSQGRSGFILSAGGVPRQADNKLHALKIGLWMTPRRRRAC